MLLDRGIAHVYRVDGTQRGNDITKGLPEVYRNWFGARDHTAEYHKYNEHYFAEFSRRHCHSEITRDNGGN